MGACCCKTEEEIDNVPPPLSERSPLIQNEVQVPTHGTFPVENPGISNVDNLLNDIIDDVGQQLVDVAEELAAHPVNVHDFAGRVDKYKEFASARNFEFRSTLPNAKGMPVTLFSTLPASDSSLSQIAETCYTCLQEYSFSVKGIVVSPISI